MEDCRFGSRKGDVLGRTRQRHPGVMGLSSFAHGLLAGGPDGLD